MDEDIRGELSEKATRAVLRSTLASIAVLAIATVVGAVAGMQLCVLLTMLLSMLLICVPMGLLLARLKSIERRRGRSEGE